MSQLDGAQIAYLQTDLNPQQTHQRRQGGSTLTYMEAWAAIASLIRIFGYGNFSFETLDAKILQLTEYQKQDVKWEGPAGNKHAVPQTNADGSPKMKTQIRAVAMVTVKLTIHATGAVYSETAAASQDGIDWGEVSDFAIKTATSDAMKRTTRFLGTQFGLSLYASTKTAVNYTDVVGPVWEPVQAEALRQYQQRFQQPPAVAMPQYGQVQPPLDANQQYQQPQGGHNVTPSVAGSAFQD